MSKVNVLYCMYCRPGAEDLHALGHAPLRPGGLGDGHPLHRRVLRLRALPHPRRVRGAGQGARRPPQGLGETRRLGHGAQDAHQTLGQGQVRKYCCKDRVSRGPHPLIMCLKVLLLARCRQNVVPSPLLNSWIC